jgi:tetratricopeptide (TPR) repeat protein
MLDKGLNHLIYEARTNFTYELFAEFLKGGIKGLCITTTPPRKLAKEYGLESSEIIWIMEEGVESSLDPKELNRGIFSRVQAFAKKNPECVILIDDLGYLILENGYKDVEVFLANLDKYPGKQTRTLMVPINPDSLTPEISKALAKRFDQVKDVRNYILTGNKVECPECGAMWKTNVDSCDICGYQFSAEVHKPALTTEEKLIPRKEAKVSGKLRVKPPEEEEPKKPEPPPQPVAYSSDVRPQDDSWFNRGVALEKMGKSEQAVECFDKALEQNPNDSWAWFNKGVSLHRMGLLGEALYCYDKALTYNPNDPDLLSNKGIALRTLGRTDEALECYKKALKINPSDAGIWSNMGVTYRVMGMNDMALEAYNKALKIDPYDVGVWLNKAAALQSQGKFDEAIQCYEEVLRINPYHPVALRNKEFALSRTLRS